MHVQRRRSVGHALLLAVVALAPLACVSEAPDPEPGELAQPSYVASGNAWSGGNILVCWENGGFAQEKQWVRSTVEALFENRPEFHVDFSGWSDCPFFFPGLHIAISDDNPRVSGLGDDLNGEDDGMHLNFRFNNWSAWACSAAQAGEAARKACIEKTAAHEFGHALGLAHEANRDDSTCTQSQGSDGDTQVGDFDNASLMSYCNPLWNNDGKLSAGDVMGLTRLYGGGGDVFVAPSDGGRFSQERLGHAAFCRNDELCLAGDFNGDGRTDVTAFARGTAGDVFVALSDGTNFGYGFKWHEYFGVGSELPVVGDFNGDGKDDVAVFKRNAPGEQAGDVLVALSNGSSFGAPQLWHTYFGVNDELPMTGDFNGDGKDDVIIFKRNAPGEQVGDVLVALSNGSSFGASQLWQGGFAYGPDVPRVGDFNGDGKDDVVVFKRTPGLNGNVVVSLSDGGSFGAGWLWHSAFAFSPEQSEVGDFDGDGRDDVIALAHGGDGKVFVALSDGQTFGYGWLWKSGFCLRDDLCLAGDVNGDGRDDALAFKRR